MRDDRRVTLFEDKVVTSMEQKDNTLDFYPSGKKLKAINRTRVYEEIIHQIQGLIDQGKFKNGDQLPPERELANIFGVSRYSVREAIQTLQQKGVLKTRLGSGSFVVSGKEPSVAEILAAAIETEKGQIKEVFEFRHLIEPSMAYMAGRNASTANIKALEKIIAQQKETSDITRLNELGEAFHLTLAESTGNSIIHSVAVRINDILSKTRTEISQDKESQARFVRGHSEILEAVKKRDPELARQKMIQHLNLIEQIISQ